MAPASARFTGRFVEVFGGNRPRDHRFDGKTDPQIVRELMRIVGHTRRAHRRAHGAVARRAMSNICDEELRAGSAGVTVMPGIPELLDALEHATTWSSACSPAISPAARVPSSTRPASIRRGFASAPTARTTSCAAELPAVAQRRARDELGLDDRRAPTSSSSATRPPTSHLRTGDRRARDRRGDGPLLRRGAAAARSGGGVPRPLEHGGCHGAIDGATATRRPAR